MSLPSNLHTGRAKASLVMSTQNTAYACIIYSLIIVLFVIINHLLLSTPYYDLQIHICNFDLSLELQTYKSNNLLDIASWMSQRLSETV